jgi:hypothetical protein
VTEKSKRGHREAQEGLERLQREKERLQRGLERMQSGGNREVIERLQRGHREGEKRHILTCRLIVLNAWMFKL